ncbi:MAG: hypothetical protein ABFS32_08550 [Bacteroidota bacterium]
MLRILNSAFLLFFLVHMVGFVFRFLKTPYHTIIMATGIIGILLTGIVYLLIKERGKAVYSFATFGWGLYLIAVVKFLPQTYFLITAILLTGIAVIFIIKSKKVYLLHLVFAGFLFVSSTVLALTPQDNRYYLLNFTLSLHVDQDYRSWDKYSWFLYINGKKDEAKAANNKALEIVESSDNDAMKSLIRQHYELLKQDNWKSYR